MDKISAYAIPGLSLKRRPRQQYKCHLTPEEIIDVICNHQEITRDEINIKTRSSRIKTARQIAHAMIRKHLPRYSFADIGAMVGNKDHATVMHSCRRVEQTLSTDRYYKPIINEIEDAITRASDIKEIKNQASQ